MPSKKISHAILKRKQKGDNNPVTAFIQNRQINDVIKGGKRGRGIKIGSYMDFNANSNYKEMKRIGGDKPVHQRMNDNIREYMPAPKHHKETKNLHLWKSGGERKDATEIVGN